MSTNRLARPKIIILMWGAATVAGCQPGAVMSGASSATDGSTDRASDGEFDPPRDDTAGSTDDSASTDDGAATDDGASDNDGAATGDGASDGASTASSRHVVLSEIMYHPVREDALEDNHEFIEIYNRSSAAVSLTGWTLRSDKGGFVYSFPAGSSIQPGQYLVVAKNRAKLAALPSYKLDAADLLGDYMGSLDNGSALIALFDDKNHPQDAVRYRSKFPWPIGADALGASERFLPVPLRGRQYLGRSLERISLEADKDSDDPVANWDASALDGATPGRANSVAGTPRAIATMLSATPASNERLIRATDQVIVRVGFAPIGTIADVKVEYFVDALAETNEPKTLVAATRQGDVYQATLPRQPDNSVVRYRIVANRGAGQEPITPRPSDPNPWRAYFVTPALVTDARVYHMFISPANWGQLWTNITMKNLMGADVLARFVECTLNPTWQAEVPAVFVYDGEVYDVLTRNSGSTSNRTRGDVLAAWGVPGPNKGPNPPRVLSWKLDFPAYKRFEGAQEEIYLKKLFAQACPGLETVLAGKLFNAVGVPSLNARYVRHHINGAYYQYALEMDGLNDDFVESRVPTQTPGDLFKADGFTTTMMRKTPFGSANEGPILSNCPGPTADDLYARTYRRQNHDWKAGTEIRELVDGLTAAKAASVASLRAFLTNTFKVDAVLSYIAVRNWAAGWDDAVHNHYPYRAADGKWWILAQDHDWEFGRGTLNSTDAVLRLYTKDLSFYTGLVGTKLPDGTTDQRSGPNYVKDAFFTAFRSEYDQLLRDLDHKSADSPLAPATVRKHVDEWLKGFSRTDLDARPMAVVMIPDPNDPTMKKLIPSIVPPSCSHAMVTKAADDVKKWADDRHAVLLDRLGQ
jgi:hypothetical protein